MNLGLHDKVAIVTGSARGIGAAIAQRLGEEGAKVVVTDINAAGAATTAAALRSSGFTTHAVTADISKPPDVQRLVDETVATFGALHILVNNAGFPRDGRLAELTETDWDLVLDVALKGAFLACQKAMPHLVAQRWGRIINISSRAHLGNPGQANYSAAKAGLLGLTRALALEEGRHGVTVNAVAPGFIDTDMVKSLARYEEIKARAVTATPVQRVGEPCDIADAVAFLASERASFITGETLHVTGGRYGS